MTGGLRSQDRKPAQTRLRLLRLEDRLTPSASILDPGFESPAVGAGQFRYQPSGSAWTFAGAAGLSGDSSGFTSGNPAAPQGSQVAFVQQTGGFSQSVAFTAGTYTVSFLSAQRGNITSRQTFRVLVDGVAVGNFNTSGGVGYTSQTTSSFTVSAGNHTIAFQGTNFNGGDNSIFIDQVSASEQASSLADNGFELPALSQGQFQYAPGGTPWGFTGGAGVTSNGSAFTAGNSSPPQASQALFIQGINTASNTATFAAGTYVVSFAAAQRAGQARAQTFRVIVDGAIVTTFNSFASTAFTQLTSDAFTLAAGSHTISFQTTNLSGTDATVFIDQVTVNQVTVGTQDFGFETPALANGQFRYQPTGSPWTFTGGAGVSANFSAFTSGNALAPEGRQVAFLQVDGSVSQSVSFNAGTYTLSFFASQRGNMTSRQTFRVLVDGAVVGTFNNLVGDSYRQLITSSFTVGAGNHTVQFQGTNLFGGDNTVFIDAVALNIQAAGIADTGFELPTLSPGTFAYNPSGSPWTFNTTSGVSTNGSAFTAGNAIAPQGFQVAFLQRTGSFSQAANFNSGIYRLSFLAAQRANIASGQTFRVLFDGAPVLIVNNFTSTAYTPFFTDAFAATAGSHTITFQGTNLFGGDNTLFIDAIEAGFA